MLEKYAVNGMAIASFRKDVSHLFRAAFFRLTGNVTEGAELYITGIRCKVIKTG